MCSSMAGIPAGRSTPLFVDGPNIPTNEPAKWIILDGQGRILSDLACTGEERTIEIAPQPATDEPAEITRLLDEY